MAGPRARRTAATLKAESSPRYEVAKEGVHILVTSTLFSKITLLNRIEFVTIVEQEPRLYGHERIRTE